MTNSTHNLNTFENLVTSNVSSFIDLQLLRITYDTVNVRNIHSPNYQIVHRRNTRHSSNRHNSKDSHSTRRKFQRKVEDSSTGSADRAAAN